MTSVMTKGLVLISALNLIGPGFVQGDESAAPATTTPTTAPAPAPHKHHHRKKKTASLPATGSKTVASPSDHPIHAGIQATNTDAPGMSDSLGANNPGGPNMGSSDHTPGTTGTSGQ